MDIVILLVFSFGEMFLCLLLCDVFLKYKDTKLGTKIVLSVVYSVMMHYVGVVDNNGIFSFVIFLFCLFVYGYLSTGTNFRKIIMTVFLVAVNLMVINALFLVLAFLSAESTTSLLNGTESEVLNFYTLLSKAALYFEYLCLKQRNSNQVYFDQIVWKWVACISVTSLVICHICFYEYIQNNMNLFSTFSVFIGAIVTNVLVYVLCMELSNSAREGVRKQILIEAIRYEQQSQIEMESLVDKMSKISHDFDKHILVIEDMIDKNDTSLAKEYLNKIKLSSRQVVFNTNSSVLNYMLSNKVSYAKNLGIDVHYMVVGHEVSYIDDVDMTGLVGNLLDNAIEAAGQSKEKQIELRFDFQDEHVSTFLVKNSLNHEIKKNGKNLVTTKADKQGHGIGMSVIQEIVEKYHGQDYYQIEENQFSHLCILLDNEKIA